MARHQGSPTVGIEREVMLKQAATSRGDRLPPMRLGLGEDTLGRPGSLFGRGEQRAETQFPASESGFSGTRNTTFSPRQNWRKDHSVSFSRGPRHCSAHSPLGRQTLAPKSQRFRLSS